MISGEPYITLILLLNYIFIKVTVCRKMKQKQTTLARFPQYRFLKDGLAAQILRETCRGSVFCLILQHTYKVTLTTSNLFSYIKALIRTALIFTKCIIIIIAFKYRIEDQKVLIRDLLVLYLVCKGNDNYYAFCKYQYGRY